MKNLRILLKTASCLFLCLTSSAFPQKPPGGAGATNPASATSMTQASGGSPSSSPLAGISYTRASWPQINKLPSPKTFGIDNDDVESFWDLFSGKSLRKDVMIFCYTLKPNLSGTTPFVLEPMPPVINPKGQVDSRELCQNQSKSLYKARSLLASRYLVLRIDMSKLSPADISRIQTLNFNVTTQAGTSLNSQRGSTINPTTIQPSMALLSGPPYPTTAAKLSEANKYKLANTPLGTALGTGETNVYYLAWPAPLMGDTVPTASVNLIYTPVASALPWEPGVFYPAGSIVSANDGSGHYFLAKSGGVSADTPPGAPAFAATSTTVVHDAVVAGPTWQDMGAIPNSPPSTPNTPSPAPPAPAAWSASTLYPNGSIVIASGGVKDHYYQATAGGVSAANAPAFPINGTAVTESEQVIYIDSGAGLSSGTKVKIWQPHTPFFVGDVIYDEVTGHSYYVAQGGLSGGSKPAFAITNPLVAADKMTASVQWQDLGAALPATASVGTSPSDLTLSVLNLTLPQVQVLGRFNLTSGVVVSSLKVPSVTSFTGTGPTTTGTGTPGTGCPRGITSCTVYTSTPGSRLVDPVLGITVYALRPLDAERPFRMPDLTPAPSLGISLSSPTSNFHVGLSSEFFIRNLQVMYGVSFVQETHLTGTINAPGAANNTSQYATSVNTLKKFNEGEFFGFTYDITGFIQSLF